MDHLAATSRPLMILGTGPNASKTVISVGLCRALTDRGVAVTPFKGVAVVRNAPTGTRLPPWQRALGHHLLAAGLAYDVRCNPVAVVPTGRRRGELYVKGARRCEVGLLNEDTVPIHELDPGLREEIVDAVVSSLDQLLAEGRSLVVEGAGSPLDLPADAEIANLLVARRARPRVLLTCQMSKGGCAAALVGTVQCLPPDIRDLLVGFVLSDVDERLLPMVAAQVEQGTGVRLVGAIPHLTLWDGPPETHPGEEEAYRAWGTVVAKSLGRLLPVAA